MRKITAAFIVLSLCSASAWSGVDNRLYQSPVRNQKSRGTCSAFAVAGAMEAMPGIPTELSVQYLYAVMKKTELERNVDRYRNTGAIQGLFVNDGDQLSNYVRVLQNYGVPAEHFLPYDGSSPDNLLSCRFGQAWQATGAKQAAADMHFLCQARITHDQLLRTTPL